MRCVAVNCIKELKRNTKDVKFPSSAYAIERCCPSLHIWKTCPYQPKDRDKR